MWQARGWRLALFRQIKGWTLDFGHWTLEHNFSTISHVYEQKRTALGAKKASKFTFVCRSLNSAQFLTSSTRTLTNRIACGVRLLARSPKRYSLLHGGTNETFFVVKNFFVFVHKKHVFLPSNAWNKKNLKPKQKLRFLGDNYTILPRLCLGNYIPGTSLVVFFIS